MDITLKKVEKREKLFDFFRDLRIRDVELTASKNEVIAVEFDSILFDCIINVSKNHIDYRQSGPLAIIYLVEKLLAQLSTFNCSIHIIIFKRHQIIWSQNQTLRLLREIVLRHIRTVVERGKTFRISVHEFEHWGHSSFHSYHESVNIKRIAICDGVTKEAPLGEIPSSSNAFFEVSAYTNVASDLWPRTQTLFLGLMYFCLSINLDIMHLAGFQEIDRAANCPVTAGYDFQTFSGLDLKDVSKLCITSQVDEPEVTIKEGDVSIHPLQTFSDPVLFLNTAAVKKVVATSDLEKKLSCYWIIHAALLHYIPIQHRALPKIDESTFDSPNIISDYIAHIHTALYSTLLDDTLKSQSGSELVCDLYDVRLFLTLIIIQESSGNITQSFAELFPNSAMLSAIRYALKSCEINESYESYPNLLKNSCYSLTPAMHVNRHFALLKYNGEGFKEQMNNIDLAYPVSHDEGVIERGLYINECDIICDDYTHWHSTKEIDKVDKYRLKSEQYTARFLKRFAESMMGTSGFYQVVIGINSSVNTETSSSKKRKLIQEREELKLRKMQENSENCYATLEKDIYLTKSPIDAINTILQRRNKIDDKGSLVCVNLLLLQQRVLHWAATRSEKLEKGIKNVLDLIQPESRLLVDLFRGIMEFFEENSRQFLNDDIVSYLKLLTNQLGIVNISNWLEEEWSNNPRNVVDKINQLPSHEFRSHLLKLKPELQLSVSFSGGPVSSAWFQMMFTGHEMDRSIKIIEDKRTPFNPDEWQKRMLDAIDENKSVLLCCPTSAGKTFMALYAIIHNVLKKDNHSIAIYVAPTKALVNQTEAELNAILSDSDKKSLVGAWTSDWRHNYDTCRVLVTVPEIWRIMLLSTSCAKMRNENVRLVVFDELHMISEAGRGTIWEQTLAMTTSQIIALSATPGNPEILHSWLQSTQNLRGRKLELITTDQRFALIETFAYTRTKQLSFHKVRWITKQESDAHDTFTKIHPLSSLSELDICADGFPHDLKFTPEDSYKTWQAMDEIAKKEHNEQVSKDVQYLDPEQYFTGIKRYIKRPYADEYEAEIKKTLEIWPKKYNNLVQKIIDALSTQSMPQINNWQDDYMQHKSKYLEKTVLPIMNDLVTAGKTPAIIFHLSKVGCESIASEAISKLKRLEEEKRRNDPNYEKLALEHERLQKKKKKISAKDDESHGRAKNSEEAEEPSEFNPDAIDPDFTFIPLGLSIEEMKSDIQDAIRRLRRKVRKEALTQYNILFDGLLRGIGVHHAGLESAYTRLVEYYFRRRYITFVFATSSLALGVNMPCKTVVFASDSIFLTPSYYRQMTGRAGRRGFDNQGNAVFWGMPKLRMKQLISSRLPNLIGHWPVTISAVLKAIVVASDVNTLRSGSIKKKNSSNSDPIYGYTALKSISGLLGPAFFCHGYPEEQAQITQFVRIAIEYLARERLIDVAGNPRNLSSLVCHLDYYEPGNLGLAYLFKWNIFHDIARNWLNKAERDKESAAQEIVTILAHLFQRVPLRALGKEWYEYVSEKAATSQIIFKTPLSDRVISLLETHNKRILQLFTDYVATYARQNAHKWGKDYQLPLTKIEFPSLDPPLPQILIPEVVEPPAMLEIQSEVMGEVLMEENEVVETWEDIFDDNPPLSTSEIEDMQTNKKVLDVEGEKKASLQDISCDPKSEVSAASDLPSKLALLAIPFSARSPFSALSGVGDTFNSVRELSDHLRTGLHLSPSTIPIIPIVEEPLNAYILDFFKHGQAKALVDLNKISRSDIWEILKRFNLLLLSMITVLNVRAVEADKDVLQAFEHIQKKWEEFFQAVTY